MSFGGYMTRTLLPLLVALVSVSCGRFALSQQQQVQGHPVQAQPQSSPAQASQAQASTALVGTWSATVNWNLPSGLMIITSFTANGRIQSTIQNHQGMSFLLTGVYQFNAAQSALSFKWQDYSPKQICVGGNCTPAPAPAPMGVTTTNSIRFLSPTQFVATSNDAATTYIRTNAAGFPTR